MKQPATWTPPPPEKPDGERRREFIEKQKRPSVRTRLMVKLTDQPDFWITKIDKPEKDIPMPSVDVFKLTNIESVREIAKHITEKADVSEFDFTKILMGHAHLAKRDGESDGAALERILTAPQNGELRQAYRVTKGYQVTKYPDVMITTPVSTEVGSTATASDANKAYEQLQSLVAAQRAAIADAHRYPALREGDE